MLFNTLSAGGWADIDKVVDELWKVISLRVKDNKTVKGALIQSIDTVAMNRKKWFQLVSYCHQLITQYKLKEITATFDIAWTLKKQKQRALDLDTVNGVKLSQLGAKKFGKKLSLKDQKPSEHRVGKNVTGRR
ncbi:hypothetical protein MUCCIDRAFT_114381 [Mucor lusitanicus CBS 277.49]|uniref:Uncharacterized protein n=1 Tax=Mucor lusitanicus CBS 277.49 TaxID=747725 RepID=A0A168HUG0_MUCCL|nr:hypothetical protein MUCCIDRAFT_114381 [Mucor lusitanicus CBS 277.49]